MKIIGVILVILTNCCYIANNYAVKWAGLGAGEVSLVRGVLQISVFTAMLLLSKRDKNHCSDNESQKSRIILESACVTVPLCAGSAVPPPLPWAECGLVCLYGLLSSSASFAVVTALPRMPVGDVIVICMSTPVFSIIFSALILKTRLTLLSVALCIFIGVSYI